MLKRTMRTLLVLLAAAVLLLFAAAATVAALALQREPAVTRSDPPSADDAMRAMALLRTHDPRRANPGAAAAVDVGQRDLELLLDPFAMRYLEAATRLDIGPGSARLNASLPLPAAFAAWSPFGRWVNVECQLVQTGGLPALAGWRVGSLPLPRALGERAFDRAVDRWRLRQEVALAAEVVRSVEFAPGRARVVYAWRLDSADRLVQALLPAGDAERLRAYHRRLVDWASGQPAARWTAPLAPLIGPMFALAAERSALPGADAAAENRAAIVALTLYANGRGVDTLLPSARDWPRPRPLQLTLRGRDDFALHFLVSAAIAVAGTGPLSKAIGIHKEVADLRGGSGFSFNDLAADRAGTRFGERAVAQPAELQARLARGVQDAELLPPVADLPEFLHEAEFRRRYGAVGTPSYQAMLDEIDRRVAALPVLR